MNIRVNGREHALETEQDVESLLTALDLPRSDVAVAVDGAVVPRSSWAHTAVRDGAQVEVVTARQGG